MYLLQVARTPPPKYPCDILPSFFVVVGFYFEQAVNMWSYCSIVKQIASRNIGTGARFGQWVQILMITMLVMVIPVLAAGPEGQEVCS